MAWGVRDDRANGEGPDGAAEPWPHDAPPPAALIASDARPRLLLIGGAEGSALLADWAARAGLRCIGRIELHEAAARLAMTVAVDLVMVDLRGPGALTGLDRATARALAARHGLHGAQLAVLTDLAGLDCAMAWLDSPDCEFLCEPGPGDVVGLMVMAALDGQRAGDRPQFHDATRDGETMRIDQLSDEVRRLAATIERLTQGNGGMADAVMEPRGGYRGGGATGTGNGTMPGPGAGNGGGPAERFRLPENRVPVAQSAPAQGEIRSLLRARRLREHYLPADLFADPAWDMILDLMAARLAGQRVSVSSLCIAAAVPPTTALRWIRQLTDRGVFSRIDDPADGRRVFIALTDDAAEAVIGWTEAVRRNGGLLCGARTR